MSTAATVMFIIFRNLASFSTIFINYKLNGT